jgi:D-alanyl-D-alanine carboxypeptidase (penicillin-binding protein 5/6)
MEPRAAERLVAPPIAARAYYVVDLLSGQVIVAQNAEDRFEPASLTKLMTAYLTFSALKAGTLKEDQRIPVSQRAWKAEGSRMFIDPATPVTVSDLLQGMIVQSGNDAAIALSEAVAGSEAAFVQKMNSEAIRLGLTGTRFSNPTGLPDREHYATARDLATLATRLIQDHGDYYRLYAQREFRYNNITQANRNRLLWIDPNVDGVKTGHTEAAGYCLIASARRGDRRILSVLLGASSDALRASESQKLLNFAFQAFDTRKVYGKHQPVATPEVFKGTRKSVPLGFESDVHLTLPPERFQGLQATADYTQPLVAPLVRGQKVGKIRLTRGGEAISEFALVVLEDVPVAGVFGRGIDAIRLMLR